MAQVHPIKQSGANSARKSFRNSLLVCSDDLIVEDKEEDEECDDREGGDGDDGGAEDSVGSTEAPSHPLSEETVKREACLALEELFTILVHPDIIADSSIETPESLKALFSEAIADLAYDICLWLCCMRWQFNTTDKVDQSWQLHSFVMDPRHSSHNHVAIVKRYIGLTSTPLTLSRGTSCIDDAILRSNTKFQSVVLRRGYTFKTFYAFLDLTDALDSSDYGNFCNKIADFCLTYLEDDKFDARSPLIRFCFNREGEIIGKSINELLRMKESEMMATNSQCCSAFRLITVAYCGFKVQDELEEEIPQAYRIARGSNHPLALYRRWFDELVHDLYCGPLRSTFEGMGHETWWTRLSEYRSYALEIREFIEAEKEAGN